MPKKSLAAREDCSPSDATPAYRVWFLDTLRYLLVVGVVVLHAAEPQMTLENDWAVDDPRITSVADQIIVFLDVMMMSVLFFIAGYFTIPTMLRRGIVGFWRRKFWSLVVPSVLVVVLLNPVWKYAYHLTRAWSAGEIPMGYGEAWWFFLSSVQWFEIGNIHSFNFTLLHVWFITLLLLFYVPVTVYFACQKDKSIFSNKHSRAPASSRKTVWLLIVTHLTAVVFATIAILLLTPPLQWVALGPILLFEPVYLPQYIIYFGLGLHAYRRQWFAQSRLFGLKRYWVLTFVLSAVAYQSWAQYMFNNPEALESKPQMIGMWLVRYFVCASSFVLLIKAGMHYWNSPHRIHQHLAANSYRFYLLHLTMVVLVQMAFLRWASLDWLTTLVGSIVLSLVGTYVVSVLFGNILDWAQSQISSRKP